MSTTLQLQTTQYRQFPLRLTAEMADRLDEIAKRMRINKTTISRIALEKFIFELEKVGAVHIIDEVCSI